MFTIRHGAPQVRQRIRSVIAMISGQTAEK
jgi:hypothetical protein